MPKVHVDLGGLKSLLETARRNGTTDRWCDLAIEWCELVWKFAQAHEHTASREDEAHAYCQEHLQAKAWGKNVWHAILDDAKEMKPGWDRLVAIAKQQGRSIGGVMDDAERYREEMMTAKREGP